MNQIVISDNWSLQNISELLVEGLDSSDFSYIIIDRKKDSYTYNKISSAIIKIEAIFDFLTDIILRDQILVDEKFTYAWKQYESPLEEAADVGIVRAFPFLEDPEKLMEPRNEFVNRLCVTSDLKRDHEINRSGWDKSRQTKYSNLSQTLWGGAGMLARGFVYEKGYTPHPIRRRLFISAGIAMPSEDAVIQLKNIINEKRARIASACHNNDELYSLTINMPPLPIKVIQESSSVNDLISVALQLRQEYQELRNWLGYFQQALSDGSYKDILKFKKILHSISLYVDSMMGIVDPNSPTFTAGIGVLKIAFKGQPLNAIRNQFGVRAMINNLIVSRFGNDDLKKFLSFFGHRNTTLGMRILEHFAQRSI
jgi:hypothetical protein